jgi:hypothetical protein
LTEGTGDVLATCDCGYTFFISYLCVLSATASELWIQQLQKGFCLYFSLVNRDKKYVAAGLGKNYSIMVIVAIGTGLDENDVGTAKGISLRG